MDFMALLMKGEKSNQSFFRARKKGTLISIIMRIDGLKMLGKCQVNRSIGSSSIFKQTDITNFPLQIHNFLTKYELLKKCEFKAFPTHHMFKEMLS